MSALLPFRGGDRLIRVSSLLALGGLLLCVVGFLVSPKATLLSWLAAWSFVASTVLGALVWLLIFHAANARWPVVILRPLELAGANGPLLALLFVPVAVGMKAIYPWVSPDPARGPHFLELMHHKAGWLNPAFFLVRAAIFFGIFIGAGQWLLRLSARLDDERAAAAAVVATRLRMRRLSSLALPLVGLAMTFGAFDWLMSLQPDWYSTIFGVYWFAGGFVAACALWILGVNAAVRSGLPPSLLTPSHYHSMGKLLLSFVCFWAYIGFSQLLLIWIGDLPAETSFYQARRGPWLTLSLLLPLLHFVIPFVLLLSRGLKRDPRRLGRVAIGVLVVHWIDSYWLVMPSGKPGPALHWQDVAALVTMVSALLAVTLWRLQGRLLAPVADPYFDESRRYAK